MRKTWFWALPLVAGSLLAGGLWLKEASTGERIVSRFPRNSETFLGDPMPYFDGKKMAIYYLEDHRDAAIGFHPFSLLTTENFREYNHFSEVLPYVNEVRDPERALGTGTVMQDQAGGYHCFYTAHNGELSPKERIMHAVSRDGKTWQKLPEDTFFASGDYEGDDFRDPFVMQAPESDEYWMLLTTRQKGTGVIAKYVSRDLKNWEDQGVFFVNDFGNDSNLECPSLVNFEDRWYLAFSDQWDKRVVHYRVAKKATGPFEPLAEEVDHVDGAGFYAGRLVTMKEQLYLVGWIPTKERSDDNFAYNWAGNLAWHRLKVNGAANLVACPDLHSTNEVETLKAGDARLATNGAGITIPAEKSGSYELDLVTGGIEKLIISFGKSNHLVVDRKAGRMAYYNTFEDQIADSKAITEMFLPQIMEQESPLTIVKEGEIIQLYYQGRALSNRIYAAKTQPLVIRRNN